MSWIVDHDGPLAIVKHVVDSVSAGAIVGSILGILPPIAAIFAIIWYCIQIYESKTFRQLFRRNSKQ